MLIKPYIPNAIINILLMQLILLTGSRIKLLKRARYFSLTLFCSISLSVLSDCVELTKFVYVKTTVYHILLNDMHSLT